MEWLIFVGIMAVLCGGLGAWVATQKRRSASEGLVLGLLFGPLGVLVEALLPQGSKQPGGSATVSRVRRNIDELGIIATIADRFRTALDEGDPNWERLPYHRKRALLKPVERQLMRELKLSHTTFSDYAAEARRSLLGTGSEQA
jgi:hypothetical protein